MEELAGQVRDDAKAALRVVLLRKKEVQENWKLPREYYQWRCCARP